MVRALSSSEYPTMAWKDFQIYGVQITGKCIFETHPLPPATIPLAFPHPLGMISSLVPLEEHTPPPMSFLQKVCPLMKSFFLEKNLPIF